jgi:hypothetical protein
MILAGDEAQVQFATLGARPHPSGPRGSLASPGGRSAFLCPRPCGGAAAPYPRRTMGASTVMTAASSGEAGRLCGEPGPWTSPRVMRSYALWPCAAK